MKSISNFYYSLLLICLFFLLILPPKAYGDTIISAGSVYGTWDLEGSPYIVQGDIEIEQGKTLAIEPGVVVKFVSGVGLRIDGTLTAIGTEEQMIIFTSTQESPNAGDWAGLDCYNSDIDLKWCVVEYATEALYIWESNPTLTDCVIRNSLSHGIHVKAMASGCAGASASPRITRCIIEYNSGYGVRYYGYGSSSSGCTDPKTGEVSGLLSDSIIRHNIASGIGIFAYYGYLSAGSAYPNIRNNEIHSNGVHGITVDGNNPTSPKIINNNIFENTGAGISITNSEDIKIITYNNIYQNGGVGIYNEDDDAVIDNNEITGNLSYGIETSALDSFTGNALQDNATYDFYYNGVTDQSAEGNDWGTTDPTLIDNRIYDQSDDSNLGIVLYGNPVMDFLVYYVNDDDTTYDEWCSAPGDDNNNGLTPSTPKATVQSVLLDYDLEPGDIVRIDTGTYNPESDIVITADDQGSRLGDVIFEASPYGVIIDRGTEVLDYGWILDSCDNVTVTTAKSTQYPNVPQSWMRVKFGYIGFDLRDSNWCTISRVDVYSNDYGIWSTGDYGTYSNNLIRYNGTGIMLLGDYNRNVIKNNTIAQNYDCGIYAATWDWILKNNIIYHFGMDEYAIDCTGITASDYNLIYVTSGANIGRYNGTICTTLSEWQGATGEDENSISLDPGFVDPYVGDCHLISTGGRYHNGEWTVDAENSPGLDAGNPDDDYADEPYENGERINLGAYGGTEQASKSSDMDMDGLPDIYEGDMCPYFDDADSDDDGIIDGDEDSSNYGEIDVNETNPCNADSDSDGLSDGDEVDTYDTDPIDSDTDGDGMPDGWEVQYELDPLLDDANEDPDGDGFNNLDEYTRGTDPQDSTSYPSKAMPWLLLLLGDN